MITIYATFKDHEQARHIARELLKKRLIACVNFFPIESMYSWKGKIEKNLEIGAFFKTKNNFWEEVKKEITDLHTYDNPCIERIETKASLDYEKWIESETT